ncbi:MAG: 5-formyltetrahydrofolate cyclo-ligase [Verrucomicrobiota bacterium]
MKHELRKRISAHLTGLDDGTVHQHSVAVAKQLATLPAFADAKSLAVYVSFGNEIETHNLICQLLKRGRHVCVPAFQNGEYLVAEIQDFDQDLVAGKLNILEPKHPRRVSAVQSEVWLIPGVAFDRNGNRLGRGKGYFDALLKSAPGLKIALAHDFQLLNEVPIEPHDVRMDFIITENQVVQCTRNHEPHHH